MTVRDKHIQGSPFKVNVTSGPDTFVKFGRKGADIGEFNGIFGVAVDDESRIIVTDCHNHRVQVFNAQGGFMFQFGRKGEGNGQFQCPTGVGIDPEGRIVVCERLSSRIQVSNVLPLLPISSILYPRRRSRPKCDRHSSIKLSNVFWNSSAAARGLA